MMFFADHRRCICCVRQENMIESWAIGVAFMAKDRLTPGYDSPLDMDLVHTTQG